MPQKRNPVPLEHVRVLASRGLSEAQAVLGSLHNTPFADMNDSEDPLQPLVDLAFADGIRALKLLAGVLSETTFNTTKMEARAQGAFLTVTEMADTIVRSTGLSFHQAHGIVSSAVKALDGMFDKEEMVRLVSRSLAKVVAQPPAEEELLRALDARNFVAVRTVTGGPAEAALVPEIERARAQVTADRAALAAELGRIRTARERLRIEVERWKRVGVDS